MHIIGSFGGMDHTGPDSFSMTPSTANGWQKGIISNITCTVRDSETAVSELLVYTNNGYYTNFRFEAIRLNPTTFTTNFNLNSADFSDGSNAIRVYASNSGIATNRKGRIFTNYILMDNEPPMMTNIGVIASNDHSIVLTFSGTVTNRNSTSGAHL